MSLYTPLQCCVKGDYAEVSCQGIISMLHYMKSMIDSMLNNKHY